MTKTQEVISTVRFNEKLKNITNLSLSEFKETIQIKSSRQDIASSLNEKEISFLKERGDWHGNRKYPYPYWKICEECEKIYPAMDKIQAKRNKTCGKECANSQISKKRKGRPPMKERNYTTKVTCENCGKDFWRRQDRVAEKRGNFCSKDCYTKWQSESEELAKYLKEIGPKGRKAQTEETYKKISKKLSGSSHPNWKGGVTYDSSKGNYERPILVRCPEKYSEMARKNGYVPQHRLKVAQEIGRSLKSEEVVHHIDHDSQNNEIENLMLFRNNKEHKLYEHHGEPPPIWQPSNR